MEPFGNIIIFLQSTIGRFKISPAAFVTSDRSISADDLMQVGNFQSTTELNEVELKAYEDWYKTLFDPSIDGVDESLVR
jgi:mediator of RNA polymerase II transcription subunit 5